MGKQLKLLNFYKMVANIANNLFSAFVPLIIYNATNSVVFAILYLLCIDVSRLMSVVIFSKAIQKNPELFLFLRLITIAGVMISLAILDLNLIVGFVFVSIFNGMDNAFKFYSNEILLNYSSSKSADSKNLGMTRVFEKLGVFAGIVVGGILLDFNKIIVYISAVIIYIISILPLFIYGIKNKRNSTFNKEMVSNATIELTNRGENKNIKYIVITMLLCYSLVYASFASLDFTINVFNINMAVEGITYSYASLFVALYNVAYLIGNIIVNRIEKKIDLIIVVRIVCVIMAGCSVGLYFAQGNFLVILFFILQGFLYPFLTVFVLQRLLTKSRIMGVSNKGIFVRELSSDLTYVVIDLIIIIFCLLGLPVKAFFFVSAFSVIICSFIVSKMEEKTRKILVDFIEHNEIGNANPALQKDSVDNDKNE